MELAHLVHDVSANNFSEHVGSEQNISEQNVSSTKHLLSQIIFYPILSPPEVEKVETFTQAAFLGPKNLHQKCMIRDKFNATQMRDSRQIQYQKG